MSAAKQILTLRYFHLISLEYDSLSLDRHYRWWSILHFHKLPRWILCVVSPCWVTRTVWTVDIIRNSWDSKLKNATSSLLENEKSKLKHLLFFLFIQHCWWFQAGVFPQWRSTLNEFPHKVHRRERIICQVLKAGIDNDLHYIKCLNFSQNRWLKLSKCCL